MRGDIPETRFPYGSGATVPYWIPAVAMASQSHRMASVPDAGGAMEASRLLPDPNVVVIGHTS